MKIRPYGLRPYVSNINESDGVDHTDGVVEEQYNIYAFQPLFLIIPLR